MCEFFEGDIAQYIMSAYQVDCLCVEDFDCSLEGEHMSIERYLLLGLVEHRSRHVEANDIQICSRVLIFDVMNKFCQELAGADRRLNDPIAPIRGKKIGDLL